MTIRNFFGRVIKYGGMLFLIGGVCGMFSLVIEPQAFYSASPQDDPAVLIMALLLLGFVTTIIGATLADDI